MATLCGVADVDSEWFGCPIRPWVNILRRIWRTKAWVPKFTLPLLIASFKIMVFR